MISDDLLKSMSKTVANQSLSFRDKERWVNIHNATANVYYLSFSRGVIEDVPPAGWWY